MTPNSTALHTDHYELTMLEAALRDGTAEHRATFEVFTRKLPPGADYGVFCGLGRLIDAIERFQFGPEDLDWLGRRGVVRPETLDWLAGYRFSGDIDAYREGELFGVDSPVLTVAGSFGQTVLLETIVLSILNHDSAVAAAGSRFAVAAHGRPLIEMGSRRTDPEAAVAAARAAATSTSAPLRRWRQRPWTATAWARPSSWAATGRRRASSTSWWRPATA